MFKGDYYTQQREKLHKTTGPLIYESDFTGSYTYLRDVAERIENDFKFDKLVSKKYSGIMEDENE